MVTIDTDTYLHPFSLHLVLPIYLVDRYGDDLSMYDSEFVDENGVDRQPVGAGLNVIDHLTHNVYGGRMAHWAAFYERIAGCREIRYFDIKGEYTGLTSDRKSVV